MKTGSFRKYGSAPVFGDKTTGTVFDAFVREQNGKLRMDFSWRPQKALAVSFSDDGIRWSAPQITLACNPASGWESAVNRGCVLPAPDGGGYLMWYTGQNLSGAKKSCIGVARSSDGLRFERFRADPVLIPETDREGESVMNPLVLEENGKFRMWYAAGETYEPNVICYAESDDGIRWEKYGDNPVFCCAPEWEYEQNRVGGCDVIRYKDGYLMFYIGYRDIHTACICAAFSKDGVTGWQRVPENPLVTPTPDSWDADACYKPTVVPSPDGSFRLWYNGRRQSEEYIGLAVGTCTCKSHS